MSANFIGSGGDIITLELEGVEQVQKELDTLAEDLRTEAEMNMVMTVGEMVQYWMQRNILAEGLLKSGDLFRSIFVSTLSNDEGTFAYIGPNTTDVPYAMIQNYGGTVPAHWVYPKGKANGGSDVLHWVSGGKSFFSRGHMVGVKSPIVIKPRPYIEPAYNDHQQEILDKMIEILNEAIAEEIARSGAW